MPLRVGHQTKNPFSLFLQRTREAPPFAALKALWTSAASVPGDSHFHSDSSGLQATATGSSEGSEASWRSSIAESGVSRSKLSVIIIYNEEIRRARILTSALCSMTVRRGVGDWHGRQWH